jgi:hypothetical protein
VLDSEMVGSLSFVPLMPGHHAIVGMVSTSPG